MAWILLFDYDSNVYISSTCFKCLFSQTDIFCIYSTWHFSKDVQVPVVTFYDMNRSSHSHSLLIRKERASMSHCIVCLINHTTAWVISCSLHLLLLILARLTWPIPGLHQLMSSTHRGSTNPDTEEYKEYSVSESPHMPQHITFKVLRFKWGLKQHETSKIIFVAGSYSVLPQPRVTTQTQILDLTFQFQYGIFY